MHIRVAMLSLTCALAGILAAQSTAVKMVPVTATSPSSGSEMFQRYCAACHGKDGRGNGPAAAALKTAPPDLTLISSHNNGKFPDLVIYQSIAGDRNISAHGSADMPVWGEVLKSLDGGSARMVNLRMSNLIDYLKTLQRR